MKIHDPQVLDEIARVLKAFADPTRLRLLQEMRGGERTAGELVAVAGTSQANVSKHLARLRQAGLVDSRRQGTHVVYRIAAPFVDDICDLLCRGLLERLSGDGGLRRKLRRIVRAAEANR